MYNFVPFNFNKREREGRKKISILIPGESFLCGGRGPTLETKIDEKN